jgi:hypothetical protein
LLKSLGEFDHTINQLLGKIQIYRNQSLSIDVIVIAR